MYDFTFSGTQVLLGIAMLVFGLLLFFWSFKRYLKQKTSADQTESNRTKYAFVDVFKHRPAFLKLGFISALAFSLMAFNWTQYDERPSFDGAIAMENIDIENITPITFHPPPPPPPPPPPVIEVLDDDKIEESTTFKSMDIKPDERVKPQVFVPKAKTKTVIPPRIVDEAPTIFKIVERMPVFGDCFDGKNETVRRACSNKALMSFIGNKVSYPAIAREVNIQGTVVVRFVIETDGSMSNMEIVRDIGGGLGEEALRVVKLMAETGQWTAGQQRGRPVRVQFNLPVKFKLN